MQITKIKQFQKSKGDEVLDHVVIEYSDGPREVVLHTVGERAAPEFYTCFEDLAEHVCTIAEFGTHEVERTSVSSVSITYHEDLESGESPMSVIFTARRKLIVSPQPLFFNTPGKWEKHKDVNQALTSPCLELVQKLIGYATEYVNGKREQVKMDLTQPTA